MRLGPKVAFGGAACRWVVMSEPPCNFWLLDFLLVPSLPLSIRTNNELTLQIWPLCHLIRPTERLQAAHAEVQQHLVISQPLHSPPAILSPKLKHANRVLDTPQFRLTILVIVSVQSG